MIMFKMEKDEREVSVVFENGVYKAKYANDVIFSHIDYELVREVIMGFDANWSHSNGSNT